MKSPRPRRACLHEVLVRVAREPRAHEDVEHVVDVRLGFLRRDVALRGKRAGEVRVTAVMILAAAEEKVGVGIAARADDVMHTGAVLVEAVPVERIVGDGRHRPERGERAPQPVAGADMGRVQGAGLAAEEAFGQVAPVPEIEVAGLWALAANDAKEVARRHGEGPAVAWRDDVSQRLLSRSRAPSRRTSTSNGGSPSTG